MNKKQDLKKAENLPKFQSFSTKHAKAFF